MTGPLPPGTILQRMYLKRRLRRQRSGSFIEIGTGEGLLSALLLSRGWRGEGFELGDAAAGAAEKLNREAIESGAYRLRRESWLDQDPTPSADLVISAMVLEHLEEPDEAAFLDRAAAALRAGGCLILLVPASPAHWGVEDEVAGHQRRYTREGLGGTLRERGWQVECLRGLTFPLSNLLLQLSNRQVARFEAERIRLLTPGERTVAAGSRTVPWKTAFPSPARLLLNEVTMMPFHLMQLATPRSRWALVLYAEATRD